jgi:hypothetical protein
MAYGPNSAREPVVKWHGPATGLLSLLAWAALPGAMKARRGGPVTSTLSVMRRWADGTRRRRWTWGVHFAAMGARKLTGFGRRRWTRWWGSVVGSCGGRTCTWKRLHRKATGNIKQGDGETKRKNGGDNITRRHHRRLGKSGQRWVLLAAGKKWRWGVTRSL